MTGLSAGCQKTGHLSNIYSNIQAVFKACLEIPSAHSLLYDEKSILSVKTQRPRKKSKRALRLLMIYN